MSVSKRPGSKSKKKNPLYVVTNKGKDIEMAEGLFDALVKKLHLQPAIDFLKVMIQVLLDNISNYAWFKVISEKVDELLEVFVKLLSRMNILV